MTRRRSLPVGLAALLLLARCTGSTSPPANATAPAQRIAVMAPAAAEMLDALGALDRVVGIGDFVAGPPRIVDLPRIGAYHAPNVERILSLRTEVMITAASQAAAPAHERLETLGVRVLALDTSTYAGVLAALADVGRVLGKQDEARVLAGSIERDIAEIRQRAAGLPARRVLFVVGRDPIFVAGPGSHVDEMIQAVGGTNVAHDAASPYQRLSIEAVLERLPEVIIDTSDNSPGALRGRTPGSWGEWKFLPAVERGRVYFIHPEQLVIPGIRLPEMTERMGRLIQPEAFGEPREADF